MSGELKRDSMGCVNCSPGTYSVIMTGGVSPLEDERTLLLSHSAQG